MAHRIHETARFLREFRDLEPNPNRLDKVLAGVHMILCLDPTQGHQTHHEIWAIATGVWPDIKALTVYYSFDETTVTLHSVREASGTYQ